MTLATVGNLLEAAGYPVAREYYVNDAGRQMDILGVSVWLRWLEAQGVDVPFPDGGYRGDYIKDIAAQTDVPGFSADAAGNLFSDLPHSDPDEAAAISSRT